MATKNPVYVTQVGTLLYPHITKPDTTFNPDGIFSAKIILHPSEKRTELIGIIKSAMSESVQMALRENNKLRLETIKRADAPLSDETDDDGNLTGNIILNAKMKATVKPKNGDPWSQTPALFDALNNKIDNKNINPWSGTKARLSFEIIPFYNALNGAGVTLRLKAVQIIELVEGGGRNASDYGFEPDENGWAYREQEETSVSPTDDDDLPF